MTIYRSTLQYNKPHHILIHCTTAFAGEYNTGLMVIKSLCHLVKEVTPDREKKALILGWCVEWVSDMVQ